MNQCETPLPSNNFLEKTQLIFFKLLSDKKKYLWQDFYLKKICIQNVTNICNNTNNVLRNNMERNIFQFINCEALCKNNIHKYLPVNICITIFVTSEYNLIPIIFAFKSMML